VRRIPSIGSERDWEDACAVDLTLSERLTTEANWLDSPRVVSRPRTRITLTAPARAYQAFTPPLPQLTLEERRQAKLDNLAKDVALLRQQAAEYKSLGNQLAADERLARAAWLMQLASEFTAKWS
jgi:hypothetical protein